MTSGLPQTELNQKISVLIVVGINICYFLDIKMNSILTSISIIFDIVKYNCNRGSHIDKQEKRKLQILNAKQLNKQKIDMFWEEKR